MKKEEIIRRYGIEEYKKRLEESKRYHNDQYKNNKEYRERKKESQNKRYSKVKLMKSLEKYHQNHNDSNWRKENNERIAKYIKAAKQRRGDAGNFVAAQYKLCNKYNIIDWKQYNLDALENEAINVDHNRFLLDEEYLYEHFVDNVNSNLYYGNIQILKYFVPLMCIKLYENKEFTEHNLEMIKYFDTFENITKKKPIIYHTAISYMPNEVKNDNEKNIKYMLLYNLSANFIQHSTKYPTDKKLY